MDEPIRSREARARAETALVRVLWQLTETTVRPIVLGGLVPDVLVDGVEPAPPPHLGTTDVDVYIELGVANDDATLVALEGALRAASFAPDGRRTGGWRWRGDIDGTLVKVELLGERPDAANESVTTAPSGALGVLNLRGTGFVARDHEGRMLRGRLSDGTQVSVEAHFAGLQGFLLAKMFAARARGLDRDFYDLVYVLLHNRLGGPAEAARAIRAGTFRNDLPSLLMTLREIGERFRDGSDAGATGYAREAAQTAQIDGQITAAELRADAIGAITTFLDALEAKAG